MGETNYDRRRCLSVNWEFRKIFLILKLTLAKYIAKYRRKRYLPQGSQGNEKAAKESFLR